MQLEPHFRMAQREAIRQHIAPHYALVDIPRCAAEQYPRLALGVNDITIFERTLAWDHAAGALWLVYIKVAWPDHIEEWANAGERASSPEPGDRAA